MLHYKGHTAIRRRIEQTEAFSLNRAEGELIRCYRYLSEDQRGCVNRIIEVFLQ